nr:reverse transcriptase domain-containing protein [Tanacetum cinerariifolium]
MMADQRTMAELLRVPTEGYAEAIMVPLILAVQFELKYSLINMMTSDQFFGLEKDNPHDHIRAARRWLEKKPRVLFSLGRILFPKSSMNSFTPQEQQISVIKSPIFNNGLMDRFMRHGIDTKISSVHALIMRMQTHSSSRLIINPSSNPTPSINPNSKGRNRRRSKQRIEEFNPNELSPPIVTMADQRTMAQLLQAPIEGYEDANVVPAITADNFELKHGLLTLVHPDLAGERTPSIDFHWDDFVSKFINRLFPLSKTTNLRNEITNFQQCFDKSFSEAWDRFKDLLRACPHHGFSELHQLDTFYNALNSKDQDSFNFAVGALLLDKKSQNQAPATVKAVEESCVTCGGAHSYRNCPATDGNVYHDNIQEFVSQAFVVNYNQGNTSYRPPMMSNQIRPPSFPPVPDNQNAYQAPAQTQDVSKEDFLAYVEANDTVMRNMQTQGQIMQNQLTNLTELINKFVNSNSASTSSLGTLPSNTIANLTNDLKAITTRSGVSYDGPQIPSPPSFLPKVVENEPEATKDTVQPTNNGSTKDVQPQVVQSESPNLNSEPVTSPISEPVIAPVSALKPNPKSSIPYPSRKNDERNREKANNQIEKFYQIFKYMSFEISFADALILMPKFASTLKALIGNKEKLSEMARTLLNEHCSAVLLKILPEKLGDPGKFLIQCDFRRMAECLALADLGASINLMPLPMWNKLSLPDLTPMCMTLELADRSISHPVGVAKDVYVKVGSFHFLADFVVVDFDADPRVPLILERSFLKTGRALIDVFEGSSGFSDVISSGNPTPYYDPIVSTTSSTLTPFENSDFLLEEVDAFLAIEDDPTSLEVDQSYLNPEGDMLLLEAFLNDDLSLPPPNQGNYLP